jgi:hypothetical protein
MPRNGVPALACARAWIIASLVWFVVLDLWAVEFPLRWRWSNPSPHGNNIICMAYSPGLQLGVQVAEQGQLYTSDDLIFWIPPDSGTTRALRSVAFFGSRILITGENGTVLYADSVNNFQPGTLVSGPTSDWLEGVAVSATLAVAVGDNSAIYTSLDGRNWNRRSTAYTDWLKSVTFGNGNFVAVGDAGAVLTSSNGTNWTKRTSGTAQNLSRVAFANGRFTAVGAIGTVIRSINAGTNWFSETVAVGATNQLYTVSAINTARLVAGDNEVRLQEGAGSWTNELAKSNGPPAWTYLSSVARQDFFLIGGRTGLLAEGYKTNSNPYFWLQSSESIRSWLFDLTYASNLFVAVGDHATVMTSGSGVSWNLELVPPSVTNSIFLGVGGTTNLLVAVGNQGSVIVSPNLLTNVIGTNGTGGLTNIISSTLGVLWYAVPRPTTNDLQGVAALGDLYVITGDRGNIFTSTNGTNWLPRTSPTTRMLSSVAAFPGGLVATGDEGTIVTSADGVSWTLRISSTTNWLYRVRYLGDKLVAVGENGTILTSLDGITWTRQTNSNTKWLHDVTFIDGTWFAVGKQGTLLSSSNAVDWVDRGAITLKSLYSAATDSQRLITLGVEGVILRSPVVPDLTPVEILSYARVTNTNFPALVQNLFLFGGKTDQRFTLDYRAGFETNLWITGPQLEFLDPSGTLYYLETVQATNAPGKEFYRATLTP